MPIPICDLTRQTRALLPALQEAATRVLVSGEYVLGREVLAFEAEAAAALGCRHAVGVANGTDALWLALRAVGVGPGDLVLTTPFTFFATASAVLAAGAEPVFADIEPGSFNLDPEAVARALAGASPPLRRLGLDPGRIKAVVPVHLYGQAAEMDALREACVARALPLIEDAAQAFGTLYRGRPAGALGTAAAFSFFPTKNLGAFGDGGLVTTGDEALAERVRMLRAHGSRRKYVHEAVGGNSRLDALQAALLRVKLPHVEAWVGARGEHAAGYARAIGDTPGLTPPPPDLRSGSRHSYHQYTVRIAGGLRDEVAAALAGEGIGTQVYYPIPLHLQPALAGRGWERGDFPRAEQASAEVLSLPIFPELTPAERDTVAAALCGATAPAPRRG